MDQTSDFLTQILESRNLFIRRLNMLSPQHRTNVATRFFINETMMLEIMNRQVIASTQPITISFPLDSFLNTNVIVTPTLEQVNNELQLYIPSSGTDLNCSICQDSVLSGGVFLRGCSHVYHRTCIQTWFQSSVRCPVCRRDIREGLPNQTSSASTQMTSQHSFQSEEE
jgi:hypothetical protein